MDPKDIQPSTEWAIAGVASVGSLIGWYPMDLVNRTTGRAHRLDIVIGAIATPIPTVSASSPSYTNVTTPKLVNFSAFDGVSARITSVNAGVFYGYGLTWLTLWEGEPFVTPVLVHTLMTGWAVMLPGAAVGLGSCTVSFGSGVPMGKPLLILPNPDDDDPVPRHVSWIRIPKAPKRIAAPEDMLFDFDSASLKPSALDALQEIEALLNLREKLPVEIHGYTDSKGSDKHNVALSLQRAGAVRKWLQSRKVFGADRFTIVGEAARNPVAPNKLAGVDNPAGRAKNRRVEIVYD